MPVGQLRLMIAEFSIKRVGDRDTLPNVEYMRDNRVAWLLGYLRITRLTIKTRQPFVVNHQSSTTRSVNCHCPLLPPMYEHHRHCHHALRDQCPWMSDARRTYDSSPGISIQELDKSAVRSHFALSQSALLLAQCSVWPASFVSYDPTVSRTNILIPRRQSHRLWTSLHFNEHRRCCLSKVFYDNLRSVFPTWSSQLSSMPFVITPPMMKILLKVRKTYTWGVCGLYNKAQRRVIIGVEWTFHRYKSQFIRKCCWRHFHGIYHCLFAVYQQTLWDSDE